MSALIGINLGDDAIFDLTNAKLFPPPLADKKAEEGHAGKHLPRSRWRAWRRSCNAAMPGSQRSRVSAAMG
jgi:hypothetical protein